MKWLKWISAEEELYIRHAENGGEQKINVGGHQYRVDGFSDPTTVYEYYGCVSL